MSTFEDTSSAANDKQSKEDKMTETRKYKVFGIVLAVPVLIVFGVMLGVIIMLALMKIPECDCAMTIPVAMTTPIAMTTPTSLARNCSIATCSAEYTTESSSVVKTTVPLTTSQATCSNYSGYTYDQLTSICYKIIYTGVSNRSHAVDACQRNSGGRLLRVDSAKIKNFSMGIMDSKFVVASWIEGMRDSSEWLDTDGNPLSYFNWLTKNDATRCCFLVMLITGEMIVSRGELSGISVICEIRPRLTSCNECKSGP